MRPIICKPRKGNLMPGVAKHHSKGKVGRAFPASRYDDPRGGRPSALERNILRYRATEAALYLFFTEDVRGFMLSNIYPSAVKNPNHSIWEPTEDRRLQVLMSRLLTSAETEN